MINSSFLKSIENWNTGFNTTGALEQVSIYEFKPIEAKDPKILETVIRTAFNQRRKTLRNSLKALTLNDEALKKMQ